MAAPVLVWYEDDGTTPAGIDTYTPIAGTPTAAQTTRGYNDHGGAVSADTATEFRITGFCRDAGASAFTQEHPLAADAYMECRAVASGGSGVEAQTTEWTPVGKGRYLYLKDLPSDCYRTIETRINAPAGYGTRDVEVLLRMVAKRPYTVIEDGHHESGAVGVCHGVGDGRFGALLEGGNLTATGTPDDDVHYDLTTWIAKGIPYTLVPGLVTLDNLDSASTALAAGQSYWTALTLAADGTITQTKSVLGTSPLAVSTRPALPTGEPLLGYVEREFDATISTGNIDQTERVYGWFGYSSSGLVATIYGGQAMVDNRLITLTGSNSVTLTASETNFVWMNPSGTFTVTLTEVRPQDRSLLLWKFTTDGSAVTVAQDRRVFCGRRIIVMRFEKDGTLAGTNTVYSAWPSGSLGYGFPLRGVFLALGSPGATSGSTICDLEQSDAGGSFTTIFTDQSYRPTVAQGASNPVSSAARQQVYRIEPWSRWRGVVDTIPGTASTDLSLSLMGVEMDA